MKGMPQLEQHATRNERHSFGNVVQHFIHLFLIILNQSEPMLQVGIFTSRQDHTKWARRQLDQGLL